MIEGAKIRVFNLKFDNSVSKNIISVVQYHLYDIYNDENEYISHLCINFTLLVL